MPDDLARQKAVRFILIGSILLLTSLMMTFTDLETPSHTVRMLAWIFNIGITIGLGSSLYTIFRAR